DPARLGCPGMPLTCAALATARYVRPSGRAWSQRAARCADLRVLLDERDPLAGVLEADPAALAPPDPHGPAGPGRIDHLNHHTAVTSRDDSAAGATGDRTAGLHLEQQARWSLRHRDQVEAGEVNEKIASVAAIERVRAYATRVRHRRGPWCEQR